MSDNDKPRLLPLARKKPLVTVGIYYPAGTYDRPEMWIKPELEQVIKAHVVTWCTPSYAAEGPARACVLQSGPGEGKTKGAMAVLSRMGVGSIVVPPGALAGAEEGAPIRALDELAASLQRVVSESGRPAAAIFDDVELVVGQPGGVEVTINQELLIGELQNITDHGGLETAFGPAPLFCTGNDFSVVRSSLLRPGRAQFYTLRYAADERVEVLAALWPAADRADITELVEDYPDEPVATFAELAAVDRNEQVLELHRMHGLDFVAIDKAVRERQGVEKRFDMAKVRARVAAKVAARPVSFLEPKQRKAG